MTNTQLHWSPFSNNANLLRECPGWLSSRACVHVCVCVCACVCVCRHVWACGGSSWGSWVICLSPKPLPIPPPHPLTPSSAIWGRDRIVASATWLVWIRYRHTRVPTLLLDTHLSPDTLLPDTLLSPHSCPTHTCPLTHYKQLLDSNHCHLVTAADL